MITRILGWLTYKWMTYNQESILRAYQVTFSTVDGQIVLRHLMDGIYCQVCHSKDPVELAEHNGARAVIHGILEKIDLAESPNKYAQPTVEGVNHAARG